MASLICLIWIYSTMIPLRIIRTVLHLSQATMRNFVLAAAAFLRLPAVAAQCDQLESMFGLRKAPECSVNRSPRAVIDMYALGLSIVGIAFAELIYRSSASGYRTLNTGRLPWHCETAAVLISLLCFLQSMPASFGRRVSLCLQVSAVGSTVLAVAPLSQRGFTFRPGRKPELSSARAAPRI